MTTLVPMRAEHFDRFRAEAVAAYADDNVRALRWLPEGSVALADREFDRLLPQGVATPGHHLCEILDAPGETTIGYLWFAVVDAPSGRTVYLYNIRVLPEFRGQGHAKAAMEQLEVQAAALGAAAIALHVFALNATAQALYRAVGYGITGFNLIKRLDRDA